MKLSGHAARNEIKCWTGRNRFKEGKIQGVYLDESGLVVVPGPRYALIDSAAVHAQVLTHNQKDDPERQAQRN